MASKSSTGNGPPISETAVQEAMLQQAQAAAAAQSDTDSLRSTRREPALQEADLTTVDTNEDDEAPPAYGDVYGEIRNEKDGMIAGVADDGRVNIRINQFNHRLSSIFSPALRQHLQTIQDDSSTPPPAFDDGAPPPPPLNIVIQVVGSRGDVQPFVALGKVLRTYGHRVRLATHPVFKGFVQEHGLEFFSIGGDPSRLMAFMVKNPGLMPGFKSLTRGDVSQQRRDVAEYIQGCWRSCYQAGDGMGGATDDKSSKDSDSENAARPFVADCIIANPPSFAHIHCAEKLGVPLHIMFTMPYSPTQAFPHPLANVQSSNADPQLTNYISYAMIEILSWQGLGDIINKFRSKCLGLDPVSAIWGPGMLQRLKVPHTYAWSPALIPKPKDWGPQISISGFYLLGSSGYTPAPDLKAFLEAGPAPVYIGFGSIVLDNPDALTDLIFEAVKITGQRVLLSKGWGGLGAERVPDGVFMLGNVPHDWLFQHVSCVVHHGGAGTTAAGITAGKPTLVVPFFGDQHFWGSMIARAGGPDPIPYKKLTADRLADGINFCLKPETLACFKDFAGKIATEQGTITGAHLFHQQLEPDRLRCTLFPSRPAAWRIKRTQVRLSAFAACTLANANLLDFRDLKLFRAQEYYTDEGPVDPISGGFTAFLGAFNGMFMGLMSMPTETWKAVSSSSKRSTRSQDSDTNKDYDMMRPSAPHASKGLGGFTKTLVQAPMNISVNLTKGLHNVPKLWGDDTVRPQGRISDMKTGMQAVGKEWGYGWYDGLTGLVTQPWNGAQKEGAGGFFKGMGKGLGGFVVKPGAALFSVISYSMKGVQKEVQKMFGNNVQSYIVGSRTAQGFEEWLQSSKEEKDGVIERWKTMQKYLKKKSWKPEEMMRDVLEAQQGGRSEISLVSANEEDTTGGAVLAREVTQGSSRSTATTSGGSMNLEQTNKITRVPVPRRNTEERQPAQRRSRPSEHELQEATDYQENLRLELATNEAEARRHFDFRDNGAFERAASEPEQDMAAPSYDPGQVGREFEKHQPQHGEKTTQEKKEEEIVLAYVQKQSLLEQKHKGKGRDTSTSTEEEDLQKALALSLQDGAGKCSGT